MPNVEDSKTGPHTSSPFRKVRWSGHFGLSQMNKEIEQTSPEGQLFDFREKKHAIMDEGSEGDKTSREGGLPTLPGLYHSTIQPSQRGFFRVHMFV